MVLIRGGELNMNSDIKTFNRIPSNINPWLIWGCAAIFYLYQFILRISPSIMADDLMRDLDIHAAAFGMVASFYYYGYVPMQVPAGLLLDKIGVRRPLAFAAILIMTGAFMFAGTGNIYIMSVGRLFMGIGSGFGFLSCVKTASTWLPPHRLGLVVGLSFMFGTAGAVFGGLPLAELSEAVGWKTAMLMLGGVGSLVAFLIYTVVRDRKANAHVPLTAENSETISVRKSIEIVLKNPLTYVFGLYGLIMYVPIAGYIDLWGTSYLMQTQGIPKAEAAGTVSLFYVGIGAGAPLSALVADYFKSYTKIFMASTMGLLVAFCAMIYMPEIPLNLMQVIYVVSGFFAGAQFLVFASVCEINPNQIGGCASGVHNMFCMASGMIFQPLTGMLMDVTWNGLEIDGVPQYSMHDYHFALASIPICLVVAMGLCFLMKETYPQAAKLARQSA
jgi:sugar phosphate permease